MQTKFNFYCDPGHGWIKVPLILLVELGISEQISTYSYINNNHAFLEEDCDATLFIDTMKKKGHEISLMEFHTNRSSKIRNYMSYYVDEKKPNYKQFLIDNGAYRQFCDNLRKLENQPFEIFWNNLVERNAISDGGADAFSWSISDEGFEFWNSLDTKWRREIKNRIK